jgi:hypothetical protein
VGRQREAAITADRFGDHAAASVACGIALEYGAAGARHR